MGLRSVALRPGNVPRARVGGAWCRCTLARRAADVPAPRLRTTADWPARRGAHARPDGSRRAAPLHARGPDRDGTADLVADAGGRARLSDARAIQQRGVV